jgi:hypothetical protein
VTETGVSGSDVETETRIRYFGDAARRKFRAYWLLVGPFSGLLRRALLAGVKSGTERPAGRPECGES